MVTPSPRTRRFLDAGIDGFFTDFADTGVAARNQWLADQN